MALFILEIEVSAIGWLLHLLDDWVIEVVNVFIDCAEVVHTVEGRSEDCNWHIKQGVMRIQQFIHARDCMKLDVIPREWNLLADKLATVGYAETELSLFHQGKELLNWLMIAVRSSGVWF